MMRCTMTLFMAAMACIGLVHGATFVVTAPKRPYYDTEFTVSVSAHHEYGINTIKLTYTGFPSRRFLFTKTLTLEADEVQTWGVVFTSTEMAETKDEGVHLEMSDLGSKKKKYFEFSHNTGYIFIQTDKPLYTPGQKVKYRIIALDEYQRISLYPLKVDIKNPNSIVVDRLRYSPNDAFKAQEIALPREATLGNWTITATYEGLGGLSNQIYSRLFEVREYVLPRFTASVAVRPEVITDKTEIVTITVTSKYTSGRLVRGLAEIQLGIWFPSLQETMIFNEPYLEELKRGKLEMTFNITNLLPEGLIDEQKKRLYVNVTVTETGTLETDNVEDDSTLIVKPFYSISFGGSQTQFKPGFNYTIQARVTNAAGNVVKALPLVMNVTFENYMGVVDGYLSSVTTDRGGNILIELKTPSSSHAMIIRLLIGNGAVENILGNELTILIKSPSQGRQYLQISVLKEITEEDDGILRLQYTKPRNGRLSVISILIVSRGQLLYTTNVKQEPEGESFVEIPSLLYLETLPFMRVVAYYYYEHYTSGVVVTDSIRLAFREECKEELRLHRDFRSLRIQKPKASVKLFVRGGSDMHIGLVAVDNAVFALANDQGLTRKSIFEQLARHDQGVGSGDGDTYIKSSGLVQTVFVSGAFAIRTPHNPTFLRLVQSEILKPVALEIDEPPTVLPPAEEPKPQIVRRHFPESWLFEEHYLSSAGKLTLNVTLPDSITTWSFMAVGVSPMGGVCVTKPLEQNVQKLFYVDIRFPYKVTRLEEVKIKITIFNYHSYDVMAKVTIEGSKDLCLSANKMANDGTNSTHFSVKIDAESSKSHIIKVIPLRSGNPTIKVDAQSANEQDIVEKKLYVVAEGQRMKKTLTFVLDPEAKHATFGKTKKKRTLLINTKTLKSTIYNQRKQRTKINLAMPKEYIKGTESCRISAFGDIMGDIINYAVVKSKSLMDTSLKDAEEVIGDLGPTVHALLYANKAGLITEELRVKGQKFISHSILRLLNYREESAFRLTTKSPKATWLTAVALKTLCHAAPLAYIDKERLVKQGFEWLLEQVGEDGSLHEMDWRLAKDTFDYRVMLAAEALIATNECEEIYTAAELYEGLLSLQAEMAFYLEDNLDQINHSMVLAKVAYALTRYDLEADSTLYAVEKLRAKAKSNNHGHIYWADEDVTNEKRKIPFWYRKGAKASSIEGTAFALLAELHHGGGNIDAIADWLVTQRNHQGVFVGALDSMAAIQALSGYSAEKHGIKVDLTCKLRANKMKDFSHSFNFTEKNAIHPKSIPNVPVGDVIDVITKGQGLGQMHVNVEYNVPIDKNAGCRYNVSIEVKYTQLKFDPDLIDHPLCMYCDVNCPQPEVEEITVFNETLEESLALPDYNVSLYGTLLEEIEEHPSVMSAVMNDMPIPLPPMNFTWMRKLSKGQKILSMEKKQSQLNSKKDFSYSRESLCIHVCIEYLDDLPAEDTVIEIEMLSGYEPILSDIARLEEVAGVRSSTYDREKESIFVRYDQFANGTNCFTFRVVKEEDVKKPTPAIVYIKETGNPVPSCVVEYNAPTGKSLHLFCANPSNINRGECRCFSGLCSSCKPTMENELGLHDTNQLVCNADIGYQIQINAIKNDGVWTEFKAKVLSLNKTNASHRPKNTIILTSPLACPCPHIYAIRKKPLYVFTRGVEKMVRQDGNNVYRYLLDEKSVFVSVASPKGGKTLFPKVSHFAMEVAFNRQNQCKK